MTTTATTRQVRGAQLSVAAVFFAHGLLVASWAAHIPHVKSRLEIGNGTLGLALLGMPIGSVVAIGLAAYFVPRFGSRRVVQIALLGYCVAGPFVGLAGSVAALFAALLFWGGFQGTLDISMNTQAITVEGVRRRPLMNGMHASWSVGAFAGAGVGALSVAIGLGLSPQLLVLGTIVVAIVGWSTMSQLADPPHDAAQARATRGERRISGAVLLLGAIAFASMLCEGAAADWSSVYLRDSLGGNKASSGLAYAGFAAAMVLVRFFGNRLLERFPAHVLLPALAGATSVGFAVALLIDAVPAGIAAFFLLGLGVGSVVPTAFSAAGRLPGLHPGVGVAAVSGLGWAGFVLGPPLIGQLAEAMSLPAALAVVPVLTAVIAVGTRWVKALRAPMPLP
ncbi:MAG TPA: MFS transporter [Jatrophihabitans sp.]|nr:MFS transporter [Jatrophihabitans sp.]